MGCAADSGLNNVSFHRGGVVLSVWPLREDERYKDILVIG